MRSLVVALDRGLFVARQQSEGAWQGEIKEEISEPRCLAVDRARPERLYCGSESEGVWRSDDGGQTWQPVGDGIEQAEITAVAVGQGGIVYVGTEPSRMYCSRDDGDSWELLEGLTELPSSDEWSFPPRPYTHHVRWIEPDPNDSERLFVAIEAGALVRSPDGGETWLDRVPGGPYDTHTLATHPDAPGRLYSAAGDGYFESHDAGRSWHRPMEGLRHRYFVGVAVDPANPDLILASASAGPRSAYNAQAADSYLYRKVEDEAWEVVREGLPEPRGMTINILATHPNEPGQFYSANNHGLFHSSDAGRSWAQLDMSWPDDLRQQRVHALTVLR